VQTITWDDGCFFCVRDHAQRRGGPIPFSSFLYRVLMQASNGANCVYNAITAAANGTAEYQDSNLRGCSVDTSTCYSDSSYTGTTGNSTTLPSSSCDLKVGRGVH
jgi:hypothetical protein